MFKLFLTGALVVAVVLMTGGLVKGADAAGDNKGAGAEKKEGGGGGGGASDDTTKVKVGDVIADTVMVVGASNVALAAPERIAMVIALLLLAIIVAQLTFLRSSIEKLSGERSLSNPVAHAPMR